MIEKARHRTADSSHAAPLVSCESATDIGSTPDIASM